MGRNLVPNNLSISEIILLGTDLLDEASAFRDSFGVLPLEHSRAMAELASYPDVPIIESAFIQGSLLIEVSDGHTRALTKTVTEPAETLAPWSITRTVIESSALSCWLFDPNINAQTRAARSLGYRYVGLSEQSKIANKAKDSVISKKIHAQMDALEDRAVRLGFQQMRNKKGKRDGIGLRRPSLTGLVNETLNMEVEYRLFSSVVHSHSWATSQVGFKKIPTIGGFKLEKSLSLEAAHDLMTISIRAIFRAIWQKSKIYGWDIQLLEKLIDKAFRRIQIAKTYWFWRN